MALIIQIALGIFLGYLLVVYRAQIGSLGVIVLKAAISVIAVLLLIAAFTYVLDYTGISASMAALRLGGYVEKILLFLLAIPIMVILCLGSLGLCLLVKKMVSRWFVFDVSAFTVIWMIFVAVLITLPIDYFLRANTSYEQFYSVADDWSRKNGYADLLGSLMTFSLTLWPWVIIFIGRRLGVEFFMSDDFSNLDQSNDVET